MRTFIAIVLAAVTLTACAVPQNARNADGLTEFTISDLEAAHASAAAHDDRLAQQCWAELIEVKRAAGDIADTEVKGLFSAIQKARNARRRVSDGMSDEVKIACGPFVLDVLGEYSRLIAALRAGL